MIREYLSVLAESREAIIDGLTLRLVSKVLEEVLPATVDAQHLRPSSDRTSKTSSDVRTRTCLQKVSVFTLLCQSTNLPSALSATNLWTFCCRSGDNDSFA
jgi:hypothetical protein